MVKSLKKLIHRRECKPPTTHSRGREYSFSIITQTIERASLHRYLTSFHQPIISGFFGSFRVFSGKPATNPLPIRDAGGHLPLRLLTAKLNSNNLIFQNIFTGSFRTEWPFLRFSGNSDRYRDSRFGNEERRNENA